MGLTTIRGLEDNKTGPLVISHAFAYKIHLLEECRNFCLLHVKKLDWFNKLPQEDKTHKAMIAKNKYKRYTKYTSNHMRDQLLRVHEAYQSLRSNVTP